MDRSELDSRYFIDSKVYNCPFCKRNNVRYNPTVAETFDWSNNKKCRLLIVQCASCGKKSMHISDNTSVSFKGGGKDKNAVLWSRTMGRNIDDGNVDDLFFYNQPTSFFALDDRIPRVLRELITEAEGCLNSNFLTGASACVRKVIFELAVLQKAEGDNYEDKIKSLKSKETHDVDDVHFDTLLTIHEATSSKVHENAYDEWESKHLRVLLAALLEVLEQMYVIPKVRQERRQKILEMKQDLLPEQADDPEPSETEQSET